MMILATRYWFVLGTFLLSVLLYLDRICISAAEGSVATDSSPSWSVCIDIGGRRSGLVSGTMNMAGSLGSIVTGLAFPYLAAWTGAHVPFFYVAATLNGAAILMWPFVDPRRNLEAFS